MNSENIRRIVQQAVDNSEMSDYPRIDTKKPYFITNHLTKPMGKYNGFKVIEEEGEYIIAFNLSSYKKPKRISLSTLLEDKMGVFLSAFWGVDSYREINNPPNHLEYDGTLEFNYNYYLENLKN